MAKAASAASWQVKALVEATPISGPAKVGSTMSASRAMELSGTLTMAMVVWPLRLGIAQRRQRVGGFARLRDEQRRAVLRIDRIAIAQFGGDIDFHRQARQLLEPVFADHAGIIGGAAGARW